MKHDQAKLYLTDLVAGELDADLEASVRAHTDTCDRCQNWLDTCKLFTEAQTSTCAADDHPETDLLALCAVRPEEIYERDREELRVHLEQCATCRQDVETAGAAIAEARPDPRRSEPAPAATVLMRTRPQLWLAAGLAALALAATLWFVPQLARKGDVTADWQRSEPVPVGQRDEATEVEELSGRELAGANVIQAEQDLKVTDVRVMSGASLDIRGGDRVSFGQGFQIGPSARLSVETSQPEQSGRQQSSGGNA